MKICCDKFRKLYISSETPLHQNGKDVISLLIMKSSKASSWILGAYIPQTKELVAETISYCPGCGTNLEEFYKEL